MEVPRKLLAPTCKTANNSAAKEASPAKTAMRHPPSPQAVCRMRKLSMHIHLCLIDTLFKNAKVSHFVASCRTTPTLHHVRNSLKNAARGLDRLTGVTRPHPISFAQ